MSKELVKKQTTELAETKMEMVEGSEVQSFVSLIKIPRISVLQKTSKPVEDDKGKIGDMYDNLSGTVVCAKDKPFRFIPLILQPIVTKYKPDGNKYVYESHVPMTAQNQKAEWDIVENGINKRVRPEIQCYMLAVSDLDKDGLVMPYLFSFKGASMPVGGKNLFTFSLLLQGAKQPIYSKIFEMTNEKKEKDGNTYQVVNVSQPKESVPAKYHETIIMWVKTLGDISKFQVADEVEEVEPSRGTDADVQF